MEQVKFMLKYIHGIPMIPALKEMIFGFVDEPIVLVPKLKNVEFDLDLATMPGFNLVHTGSLQFLCDEDLPINPKVHQKEQIYYGSPSSNPYFESTDFSSNMAVVGSSSDATIESSLSSSANLALVSTENKVTTFKAGTIIFIRVVFNNSNFRECGPFTKTLNLLLTQLGDTCGLRTLSSFNLRQLLSNWLWKIHVSWRTEKKMCLLCMTKTDSKTSRRKRSISRPNLDAKSPLELIRIVRQNTFSIQRICSNRFH